MSFTFKFVRKREFTIILTSFFEDVAIFVCLANRDSDFPSQNKGIELFYKMLCINEYRIDLAIIADGSQAKVARAFNTATQELLAVKIYSLKDRASLLCFENEACLLHQLRHVPEVILAKSCFSHKQFGFLVMNIYKQDLLSLIMRENGLGELGSLYYFKQICEGVKKCHDMHIAHLDIKPENILIDDDEQKIHICDFGNAFQFENSDDDVQLGRRGTLVYCAPEVKHAKKYNPVKADIWSLGILLHVMAVGYFPHAQNQESIEQFHEGFVDLSFIAKECSPSFVNLLSMILDPENRPSISSILSHSCFQQLEANCQRRTSTIITQKISEMFNLRRTRV